MLSTISFLINSEYFAILCLIGFSLILSILILGAAYFVGFQKPDVEKVSVYECGFEPYEDARNTFDVRFFLIGILFIVFDLETMFLFPWAVTLHATGGFGFWIMVEFLVELLIGYFYVWRMQALEWV